MKKALIILGAVYGAGAVYEWFAIPVSDPDKTKKVVFWPYYFATGAASALATKFGSNAGTPPGSPTPTGGSQTPTSGDGPNSGDGSFGSGDDGSGFFYGQ